MAARVHGELRRFFEGHHKLSGCLWSRAFELLVILKDLDAKAISIDMCRGLRHFVTFRLFAFVSTCKYTSLLHSALLASALVADTPTYPRLFKLRQKTDFHLTR